MKEMNKKTSGALLTAFGGMCWGMSGSMGQYLFNVQGMDSRWLVPIRLGLAGVILLVYGLIRWGRQIFAPFRNKRDAILLLIYGIPGVALSQFLYFLCIQLSSAGVGTILQDLSPIPILLIGCLKGRRLPHIYEALGIILALTGVFCLVTHGDFTNLNVSPWAILAGVGSALCITIYNELGGPLQEKYSIVTLQGWSFLLGGIVMALAFQSWKIQYVPNASGYFGIAFVVIVGNVLAFTTYMVGITKIGPEIGILYEFAEPVTAAIITGLFLGSPFGGWDLLGFVLIFLMMVMISNGSRIEVALHRH